MKLKSTTLKLSILSLIHLFVSFSNSQLRAQVTVGSEITPKTGSLLDLKENNSSTNNSNKGLGLPRVALIDKNLLDPCVPSSEVTSKDHELHLGLVVYNVTDDMSKDLCAGIHVWNANKWIRIPEPCTKLIDPALINTPNCYIVAPNGGVSEEIPVGKPYLIWPKRSDLGTFDTSGKVSVDILWQDTQNLIDKVELVNGDEGGYSKFKVTSKTGSTGGNALVAFRVGPNGNNTDPIRWSWHIWVTDYNPNTGTSYTNNNGESEYIFMDRNLGALSITPSNSNSMGLMYQWGRKDPFTSANSNFSDTPRPLYSHPDNNLLNEINEVQAGGILLPSGSGIKHTIPPVAVPGSSNLSLSIKNPMDFYYGPYIKGDYSYTFDWYSGNDTGVNADNNLWTASGDKSVFDPCPAGWKVPAYSTNNSPWYPYVNPSSGGGWEGAEGVNIIGNNGYDLVGNVSRNALGYYPSGFPRASRSYFTGGAVGSDNNYPNIVGGLFVSHFEEVNGQSRHVGYYWTASVSDNIKSKSMHLNIGMMGGSKVNEAIVPKATGALVRCVKDK